MEIHLPTCYAGAAGSHYHPHVHPTPHLHGMESREGTERKTTPLMRSCLKKQIRETGVTINVFVCGVCSVQNSQLSQLSKTSTDLGTADTLHLE